MSNGNRLEQQVALLDAAAAAVAAPRPNRSRGEAGGIAARASAIRRFESSSRESSRWGRARWSTHSSSHPCAPSTTTWRPRCRRWFGGRRHPRPRRRARSDGIGAEPIVSAIAYDDRADYCSEAGNHDNDRGLQLVELGLPAPMLAGGHAARRHARRRWARVGPQRRDRRGVAGRRRGAVRVRRRAGAERARARLPAGRVLRVPRRHRGREQDRLPARVATHRRARPRSPRSSRPSRRGVAGVGRAGARAIRTRSAARATSTPC